MNKMGISNDPGMLGVNLQSQLTESPSVSTFLPEEDASICPLLPNTPSPPPLAFSHPLTPSADNDSGDNNCGEEEQTKVVDETASNNSTSDGSSSGIVLDVAGEQVTTSLFNNNKHVYKHLVGKSIENGLQENPLKFNAALLNISITKDTPCFVSWNWPFIRKFTFFVFMSSLLAMCAIVVAMIITLPKVCNPKTAWYRGSVFYEIFPASFQDSNNDGIGDLRGISNRLDYLDNLGINAIRLNSIFPSKHYPDHYQNITSLIEIDDVLGTTNDLIQLIFNLHSRNMSLILDLPIYPYLKKLEKAEIREEFNTTTAEADRNNYNEIENSDMNQISNQFHSRNVVTDAIRYWLSKGVDGFYIKGLEHFKDDPNFLQNLIEWKYLLGSDRVLIVNEILFDINTNEEFKENNDNDRNELIAKILDNIDLIDIHLDIKNGTISIIHRIKSILSGLFKPTEFGPWIQWTLGDVLKERLAKRATNSNATKAALIMQLMLPGTPSIFYGDEIALEESYDPDREHNETKHLHHLSTMIWNDNVIKFTGRQSLPWLPYSSNVAFHNYDDISKMIKLRDRSPSIYKNSIMKEDNILSNTNIHHHHNNEVNDDIIIIERTYPRRNTFIGISNFGINKISMDLSSLYYSGQVMVSNNPEKRSEKIYFSEFEIDPLETVVVKLDK